MQRGDESGGEDVGLDRRAVKRRHHRQRDGGAAPTAVCTGGGGWVHADLRAMGAGAGVLRGLSHFTLVGPPLTDGRKIKFHRLDSADVRYIFRRLLEKPTEFNLADRRQRFSCSVSALYTFYANDQLTSFVGLSTTKLPFPACRPVVGSHETIIIFGPSNGY
jgi:hypothetical protein